jgi:hypothetical protein
MHPSLWDNSDADYADKIKKDNGWRAVMSSMYGDEKCRIGIYKKIKTKQDW